MLWVGSLFQEGVTNYDFFKRRRRNIYLVYYSHGRDERYVKEGFDKHQVMKGVK